MAGTVDLETMERDAYRASYADGVIDLFAGLSLIWIGVSWIWVHDASALAGVLPAVLVAPMLVARKRFVEARLGYVQWRAPRRRWERRNLWMLLAAGIILLLLGASAALLLEREGAEGGSALSLAPGILAWLLALLTGGLAILMDTWRMLVYAVMLATTGLLTVLAQAMPGWPMLTTGLVATAIGSVMLWRFVHRYPTIQQA